MPTVQQVIEKFGVEIDEHLDRQVTIPIVPGLQAQGDVAVVPATMTRRLRPATTQVLAAGYPVVRGEVGANTHQLMADGAVFYDADTPGDVDLRLGVLTVAEDATAYLIHPEHGATGIAPGTYEIRRQREQADEIRLVQD